MCRSSQWSQMPRTIRYPAFSNPQGASAIPDPSVSMALILDRLRSSSRFLVIALDTIGGRDRAVENLGTGIAADRVRGWLSGLVEDDVGRLIRAG